MAELQFDLNHPLVTIGKMFVQGCSGQKRSTQTTMPNWENPGWVQIDLRTEQGSCSSESQKLLDTGMLEQSCRG